MYTKKLDLKVLLVTGEDLLLLTLLKINYYRFSYCNPERKDTVYMRKYASGERLYAEK